MASYHFRISILISILIFIKVIMIYQNDTWIFSAFSVIKTDIIAIG